MKRKKISIEELANQALPTPPQTEIEAACDQVLLRLQEELKKYDTSLWSWYGDGWSAPATTQLEFQVLSAASALNDRTDMNSITRMVEGWTGGHMIARVQSALEDLVKRGLMKMRRLKAPGTDAEPEFRFDLTQDGERAIRRAHAEGKQLVYAKDGLVRGEA